MLCLPSRALPQTYSLLRQHQQDPKAGDTEKANLEVLL